MPPRSRRLRQRQAEAPAPVDPVQDDELLPDGDADVSAGEDPAGLGDFTDSDLGEPVDDGGFAEAEDPADEANVPARSGRRAAGRSARRSGRGARESQPKAKPARERRVKPTLTPEQLEARRKAMRMTILIVVLVAVLGGGGYAAWYFLIREPVFTYLVTNAEGVETEVQMTRRAYARRNFQQAEGIFSRMSDQIRLRNDAAARASLEEGIATLRIDELGNLQEKPNPEDALIGDLELARRAYELWRRFEGERGQIRRIQDENKALANLSRIQRLLADINDPAKVPDLDQAQTAVEKFLANPVEPEGASDPIAQATFKSIIDQIDVRKHEIAQERERRRRARTTDVVPIVRGEAALLVQSSRFGEALRYIQDQQSKFPEAALGEVRAGVLEAARQRWEADKTFAVNRYEDFRAPGSAEGIRSRSHQEAVERLNQVIANYGGDVPEIRPLVEDARRLLREYEASTPR